MKNNFLMKALILLTAFFLFSLDIPKAAAASGPDKLLPQSSALAGWKLSGDPYHYLPENLYKYINGAADLFISYGFIKLAGGEYVYGSAKQEILTVDIYDMGNKLNAFGVFQSKRDPECKSLAIGTGAFGSPQYVFFYNDRYYVEIQIIVSNDKTLDRPAQMARLVADGLVGDRTPPDELKYLPAAGRVNGSEIYITGGILGHAFLDRGLVADYNNAGEVVKVFIAFLPTKEIAVTAIEKYKDFLTAAGKKHQELKGIGERGFASQEPYHKNILVLQQGPFVVGIADLSLAEKGNELLKSIIARLKNPS